MKPKTYICRSDAEAHGLAEGTIGELVIPMDPQPVREEGVLGNSGCLRFPWATFYDNGIVHTWDRHGVGGQNWNAKDYPNEDKYGVALSRTPYRNPAPYQPGDVIAVRLNVPLSMQGPAFHLLCLTVEPRQNEGRWEWRVGVKLQEKP